MLEEEANFGCADEQVIKIRQHNKVVVEDYLSRKGESRLTRYQLFTENGIGGLWTNDTLQPIVSHGHEGLKAHGIWSLKCFPDWEWYNIRIFETQDPNFFWAECDGRGQILFPGYEAGYYENHFLHSFEFINGKINRQREFMNPFSQILALGVEIPKVKREGFPS